MYVGTQLFLMADNIYMIKVSGCKQNLEAALGAVGALGFTARAPMWAHKTSQIVKTLYLTNKQPTRFDQIQRYKIV